MFSDRTKKIINDVAEDVDCGESRKVLRETISEMADEWMNITQQEHLKRMDDQTEAMLKLTEKMDALQKGQTSVS